MTNTISWTDLQKKRLQDLIAPNELIDYIFTSGAERDGSFKKELRGDEVYHP